MIERKHLPGGFSKSWLLNSNFHQILNAPINSKIVDDDTAKSLLIDSSWVCCLKPRLAESTMLVIKFLHIQ